MQFEKSDNKKSSLIKSVIEESKKIRAERAERGVDLFSEKRSDPKTFEVPAQIQKSSKPNLDYKKVRDTHVKLSHLIVEYDKKIFDKNNQVLEAKKPRSKSVHLYIDENIESFLIAESSKSHTKWGLRKNAGFGSLIQKFIENFIEIKKREEKQIKRIGKIISDFQIHLVEFKNLSKNPNDYVKAEECNQNLKAISNDLQILLTLLEFEDECLKKYLLQDQYTWIDFIIRWKHHS